MEKLDGLTREEDGWYTPCKNLVCQIVNAIRCAYKIDAIETRS